VIRRLKHFSVFAASTSSCFRFSIPDEIDFPFERATRFEDLETNEEIMAVPGPWRDHYS